MDPPSSTLFSVWEGELHAVRTGDVVRREMRDGVLRKAEAGTAVPWEHGEQGREDTLRGVSARARYITTGWAQGVREGVGWDCLEFWQEHSSEPLWGHGRAGV